MTPTGTVQFFNGSTPIGGPLTLNAADSASSSTMSAVMGQSSSNVIRAVYSGSTNYSMSTSAAIRVVWSLPGFDLTSPSATVTVQRGQTGLATFTLTPTFGFKDECTPAAASARHLRGLAWRCRLRAIG